MPVCRTRRFLPLALLPVFCLLTVAVALRPATAGGKPFGPAAVWSLPESAWRACLESTPPAADCLSRLMGETKASPEALAVNRRLDGDAFMSAFHAMGRVDLATMTFPLRANTNQVLFLVNGSPELVSTELPEAGVTIEADPAYAGLKQAFPEMALWTTNADFLRMEHLPDGGQGFVFAYPLLNGCHACPLAGHALIALDFGPDGVYRGPRLLRLEPVRPEKNGDN